MSVNKQIIVGNLGKEPEVRQNEQGYLACRFTVAATENGYTMSNGIQVPEHTEWFNIYLKGSLAEVAQKYLHKGDKVYIEGKTVTREYVNRQGLKGTFTEVQCSVLELLVQRPQGNVQQPVITNNQMPQNGQHPQQTGVFGQPANVPCTDPNKPW